MKKFIYILFILIFSNHLNAHIPHYNNISSINMEIYRNNKLIGFSNFIFEHTNEEMIVKNSTKFDVKILGNTIFSLSSKSIEGYKNNKLLYFKSTTYQNDKKKYVSLKYDETTGKLIIDGSSFKGFSDYDAVIGSWWNHDVLEASKQISPISGSIKEQIVNFLGSKNINLYNNNYLVDHYTIKSKEKDLPNNKKLNFDVWINKKNNIIVKVSYSKMGNWEYRLKNLKTN